MLSVSFGNYVVNINVIYLFAFNFGIYTYELI